MDGETYDFSALANKFGVKEEVIESLYSYVNYPESFEFIISSTDNKDFWEKIDKLPVTISMHLHSIQIELPNMDKDFTPDCLSPELQKFWAANCINTKTTPLSSNCVAFSRIYPDDLDILFKRLHQWRREDDDYVHGDFRLSIRNFIYMCDAYSIDGYPWLFCDIDIIRKSYIEMYEMAQKIPSYYDHIATGINEKIIQFQYENKEVFVKDIALSEIDCSKMINFHIPSSVLDSISRILEESYELIKTSQKYPPIGPLDDWTISRTEGLVRQIGLPLHQRSAFDLTPQIFLARIGEDDESYPYEPNSITELLLSNAERQTMALPYSHCFSELPKNTMLPYVRSCLRRFIAKQLIQNGFSGASNTSLDVLTDVIHNDIKCIGRSAAAFSNDISDPLEAIDSAISAQMKR